MFLNIPNRKNVKRSQQALIEGEKIIHACTIHAGIFAASIGLYVIAILAGFFFHPFMGALIFFINTFYFANAYILYISTELTVTNKRVLAYYGVFVTDLMQIGHNKLESAHIEQTLLGGMLGFKTVSVQGTGQGAIPVPFIADAEIFKRHLDEILFNDQDAKN